MREALPGIPSRCGMGISFYQNEDISANANEIYNLGYRKVRAGGTSPLFAPLSDSSVTSPADIPIYKALGFYIEKGCSHIAGVDPILTSSNWSTYHDYALALAQYWYAVGLDAFMIGNEMINHVDGTTLTNDGMYSNLVQLAMDIHAVCPTMKIVYNGTANEMATWSTWIGAHGAIPTYMQLGFNLYGSGDSDTSTFQSQVNAVAALNGYISEWNLYFDWNSVTFDQELQKTYMAKKYSVVLASSLDNYFFVWKFQNTNVPGNWSDYSVKYSNGVPSQPGSSWGTRKFADSLFTGRSKATVGASKSLSFNGSAYATYPAIPSGGGISLAFWYNRQEVSSGEKYIIGNANPGNGYKSAFRLFHDAGHSRDLVFSTYDDVSSLSFNTISAIVTGVWIHIAITIIPSGAGAIIYINGVPITRTLPGFIGAPTDQIVIGARAGDLAEKAKMGIWDLAIQNTGAGWTQDQILAHMNNRVMPTGSSWFDFNIDANDQSGSGNHLTLSGTSFLSDIDQLYSVSGREASGTRDASGIREVS